MGKSIIIRTDGNPKIGAGHVVRCAAIARQSVLNGSRVLFVVSNDVSRKRVEEQGFEAYTIGGDALAFNGDDGAALASFACSQAASSILVDSYAATKTFFEALKSALRGSGTKVAYIDDAYTFEYGMLEEPHAWPIDVLVNYTFGSSAYGYETVYGALVERLVGPRFAPIRPGFACVGSREAPSMVRRVLLTSGSTNPNCTLERFVDVAAEILPDSELNVVVGNQAAYAGKLGKNVTVLSNVEDMASLMRSCDVAVSAAGSTLYELCATGLPSIAVPIVENQVKNAVGFTRDKAGLGLTTLSWNDDELAEMLYRISQSKELRMSLSRRSSSLVDGMGAARIAECL